MTIVDERRHGRHLNGVRIVRRILEQSVVRIEEFARQQEEELARRSAVVEALLGVKENGESTALQILFAGRHDAPEGVLQQIGPADVQSACGLSM